MCSHVANRRHRSSEGIQSPSQTACTGSSDATCTGRSHCVPLDAEDVVAEAPGGEGVEVGQVDLPRALNRVHPRGGARLGQEWSQGGVAQLAEAGRLNRPQ